MSTTAYNNIESKAAAPAAAGTVNVDGTFQEVEGAPAPTPVRAAVPAPAAYDGRITKFDPIISRMQGYLVSAIDINVRKCLTERTQQELPSTVLARPAVHKNQRHVAVGTDYEGSNHYLMCCDTDVMTTANTAKKELIAAHIALPQGIQDTHWLGEKSVLVCLGSKTGPSRMQIYNVNNLDSENCEFVLRDDCVVSKDSNREIAVNRSAENFIAYGGHDQELVIQDFNHNPRINAKFQVGADISSVRWSHFGSYKTVSCGTDQGLLKVFDVTSSNRDPVFTYQADAYHKELWTHERISDFQVVLGFGDNTLLEIDLRTGRELANVVDPFPQMIGDLKYNDEAGMLLSTGMADFSVWKHHRSGPKQGVCEILCHSKMTTNKINNLTDVPYHGSWLDANRTVATHGSSMAVHTIN